MAGDWCGKYTSQPDTASAVALVSNTLIESTNTKLRPLTRIAYGFRERHTSAHSPTSIERPPPTPPSPTTPTSQPKGFATGPDLHPGAVSSTLGSIVSTTSSSRRRSRWTHTCGLSEESG